MWLKNLRARPPKKSESDWFKKKPWANITTGKNEKKSRGKLFLCLRSMRLMNSKFPNIQKA